MSGLSVPASPDLALVAALETRLVNAWPAIETQICEGWILRFAGGYSKRANSASPLQAGADLDDALLRHILAQFEAQDLTAVVRLTGLEASGVEERLAAAGLVSYDPSLCLVAPTTGFAPDGALAIASAPDQDWSRAAAGSYGGDKADHAKLQAILDLIRQDAAFATLREDGEALAWGLAVQERGWVGLYDIVVAPHARGRGLGRRLVTGLMAWGAERGAERAYLQMRETNETAAALYESLGFRTAYRYTHRIGG